MENRDGDKNWIQKNAKSLGLFAVIISDLVGYTGAGVGLGYFAWAKLGWPWWILLITSLSGLTLAFYRLYLLSKKGGME